MSRPEVILTLQKVTKSFDGLAVLSDLSFDVRTGERLALIGPNGAGKTTVFNLISGAYPVDAGAIVLDDRDITGAPPRARARMGLARSFQNIRLMPHLSVVADVMIRKHARARSPADLLTPLWLRRNRHWRQEAEDRLRAFGLDTYPHEVTSNLPYGVRKKIEVVRALMNDPKVLLLDEPAAGLDPRETHDLQEFLHGVSEQGVTLLVIEHDMSLVRGLCAHTVVLNFGRKIFDGPTSGVQDDPQVLEAYLGPREGEPAGAAGADAAGSRIHAA